MIRVEYKAIEDLQHNPAAEWQSGSIFCEREWLTAVAAMGLGNVGRFPFQGKSESSVFGEIKHRR